MTRRGPTVWSRVGWPALALATLASVVAQTAVLPVVAWHGVVPNLVLILVAGWAVARGPQAGMAVGFAGGLLLDLAPPADHVAGRWALALVCVGYLAGQMRSSIRAPRLQHVLATVAVGSFVGTSLFALTGLLLADGEVGPSLAVIATAVLADLVAALVLVPLAMRGSRVARPAPTTPQPVPA